MATLIPAIGTCASRMTAGERRLAERLSADDSDGIPLWSKPSAADATGRHPPPSNRPACAKRRSPWRATLASAHKEGHAWGDMGILCADWKTMDLCADALNQRKLPCNLRKRSGDYNPAADAIQIMTKS